MCSRNMMRQILDQNIHSEKIDGVQVPIRTYDSCITHQKVDNAIALGYPFDSKAKIDLKKQFNALHRVERLCYHGGVP